MTELHGLYHIALRANIISASKAYTEIHRRFFLNMKCMVYILGHVILSVIYMILEYIGPWVWYCPRSIKPSTIQEQLTYSSILSITALS